MDIIMMTGGRNIFLHKIRNLIVSYSADPSNSCGESIFEFSDEIDICSRLIPQEFEVSALYDAI